jgi:diguanylate cyclase (GGDEF)-like protein
VPSAYSSVIGSYASLLNDLGEFAAARKAAEEALAIDTALDDRPHQGFEHLEIARAQLGERDIEAATIHLDEALRLGRELDQREIVARALLHLTEVAMARRDRLLARGLIDEAMAGLERSRLLPQLAQAYALREQLARSEHDDATALRFARKHSAVREDLIGIRASRQLAALEARHARADAEQQLALLAKDNELQTARLDTQALERQLDMAALAGLALLLFALLWHHQGVRRLNHALAARNTEIERQRAALSEANAKLGLQAAGLYQAATTDSLTGVSNRRDLLGRLEERIAECQRGRRELALLLIDFDHFKQINDRRGHLFGDRVLVAGAGTMRECLGTDDLLGRFGGEEFVAIVCDRTPDATLQLADRMRTRIAEQLAELVPELRGIATVSIGIAFLGHPNVPSRPETLIDAADHALYEAKNDGRNRVRCAA